MPTIPENTDYDVLIVGGSVAGTSFASLLKERRPDTRIAVVEQSRMFTRRVGEATVEVSGAFLSRFLGLYDHLSRHHLPKHGLRYWFTDGPHRSLGEMTEVGGRDLPHLPSFQLDRSKLDEHLLQRAQELGCKVLRPTQVLDVEHDWPVQRVRLRGEDGAERALTARWVIDASGRRTFLARKNRLKTRVEEHPVSAVWARWRNVADLDQPGFLPADSQVLPTSRRLATNHFCGYGWWVWVIPLSGGETSIGLVYDKTLFKPPGQGPLRPRYEEFLRNQPGLRELLADAEVDDDDFMAYSHLPYRSSHYMGRGWALVGDAASFIDPYYSPGLDHLAISVYATVQQVARELAGDLPGETLDEAIAEHNGNFERSYDRWLKALYQGKYELLGDAELVAASFLVDTSLYYMAVVTPVIRDRDALRLPMFGLGIPQTRYAYRTMQAFKRRLIHLARFRRKVGTYGRRNAEEKIFTRAFGLGLFGSWRPLTLGLRIWIRLELERLFHPVLRPRIATKNEASRQAAVGS